MDVKKTLLDGVLLIKPPTIFEDFRGQYIEIYNEELYKAAGVTVDFIQDGLPRTARVNQHRENLPHDPLPIEQVH